MGLAERRRGSRGVLVNVRAARALVLALAVALPAAGQSAVSAAVAVRPQEVVIGHEVQVEIRLRGVDLARMQIVPPVFVGLVLAGDRELRDGPEGPVVTYRLQASRRGRHTVGSFVIRTPGSLVVTAPLQVTVLGRAEAAAAEPVLRWRLDTTTPFVWEGVTALLELIAPAPLPLVGPALVEPAAPLNLQPLRAGSGISALDGSDRYVIPVARYRLTARVAGRTVLPGARVTVAGTERTADSVGLSVRRVPDPIAASRAVGEFARAVEIRRLGTDAAELTVELTGAGSVPFVEHPPPAVRGGSVADTVVEVDAAAARKRWRYRLRSDGSGTLAAVVPPLPYLRLPGGEPALIGAQTVTLPRAAAAGRPEALPSIDLDDRGCAAGPALARRRACRAAELHELGVGRFAAGDTATAVLALRAALRLRGWPQTRSALAAIESATGLTGLGRGADTTWPRRTLWIAGLLAAAGCTAGALRPGRNPRERAGFAASGVAALVLAAVVAAVVAPGGEAERRMAVTGRAGAAVQRVPAPEGSVTARLSAGRPVTVSRRFDDYVLIEDAAVGSGWVSAASLAALQRSR